MAIDPVRKSAIRHRQLLFVVLAATCVLAPRVTTAQGVTGTLFGTVKDAEGGVVSGATVRLTSPALIGGSATRATNEKGQLRFPALPPGRYLLVVEKQGFVPVHDEDISIGAGSSIERILILQIAGVTESIVVGGAGSRIDARDPGFSTRIGFDDLKALPTRRSSMFDVIRTAPGISATSTGRTSSLVSAFGSGANENTFLIDGTNFTATSNGVARTEPGIDFIQEIQIQSVGASAEHGSVQGAVVNVLTRQGGNRFQYDASYYAQPAALTTQPVRIAVPGAGQLVSGYERAKFRDFTTNLGGPVVRDRLWFFAGYQYLRDHDSQPGADPKDPRTYDQEKFFGKLTWQLAPAWQLVQSFHHESWVNPELPTSVKTFDATQNQHASIPAITFGHLTHTASSNTVWDVRAGRFVFTQESSPSSGDRNIPSRFDTGTGVTTGAPQQFGAIKQMRTTAKTTLTHYRPSFWGADHEWKVGAQLDFGEHRALSVVPTGVRYQDSNGQPSQAIFVDPVNAGGRFHTTAAFVTDAVTLGDRVTLTAGLRFDRSRGISQDIPRLDDRGRTTGETIRGLGTMYTWNMWSPRLGLTAKLSANGRTLLRASYGRFNQGVMTGEVSPVHPGQQKVTTKGFDPATGDYTRTISVVDPKVSVRLDPDTRTPRTYEYSLGVDHEMGRGLALTVAYVHKDGSNFIGWTDTGGRYGEETRLLPDGRTFPVSVLLSGPSSRRFLLTNPPGYSLTYNGLVMAVDKRRSNRWRAFGSYTLSRASGLQAYSGTSAAGPQVSTTGAPPVTFSAPITFGRDPNDLTNAAGRLPNDRPHMVRAIVSVDLPRTGLVIGASLQHSSGKPWAATAQVAVPQNIQQRVLLEPRGSRRLSTQSLLDLRISRPFSIGDLGRIELIVDVLNALNDTAEEGLATDNFYNKAAFGQPTVFMDPRRAMVSVRLHLGR